MIDKAYLVQTRRPVAAGSLEMDPETFTVRWSGRDVRVTGSEFLILAALAERPGMIRTRDNLLDAIGDEGEQHDEAVRTHIKRIRQKLRAVGCDHIETIYSLGYRWRAE